MCKKHYNSKDPCKKPLQCERTYVKDLVCFRNFFDINNLHHHDEVFELLLTFDEVFELLLTFDEHDTNNINNGRKEGCH